MKFLNSSIWVNLTIQINVFRSIQLKLVEQFQNATGILKSINLFCRGGIEMSTLENANMRR